jgi:hypothetical protein
MYARVAAAVTKDCIDAAKSIPKVSFTAPLLFPDCTEPVPEAAAFYEAYGPSFIMSGMPPAVVRKVVAARPPAI